ncbi:MAG: redoxin domain-containing protein [Bacteroidaceae bacterium]|nr:redoxin domain-containing protein [Bacteroidaceae bacterium]
MKKIYLGIVAALVLAGCTPKQSKQQESQDTPATEDTQTQVATEGKEAPDFTLPGPDDKPISLSSLRGQYVVLDFWGTWCKWCVKGIPDMKRYYDKYEGMFEILSIDVGDDEDTWLRAIDSYEMDWKHVITDEESAQELNELYAIEGYPTKIVVDPMGIIVKVVVGEDPEFYKFLDDLFE